MPEKKEEKKPLFKFGPFEQALAVLLVMGFGACAAKLIARIVLLDFSH